MKTLNTKVDAFGLAEGGVMFGEGPAARRKRVAADPRRRNAVSEAQKMLRDAWSGDRYATMRVNEAITTSDLFKDAVGQALDIEMLAQYQTAEKQWTKFAGRTTVRNFKPKTLRSLAGTNYSLPRVAEHAGYPIAPGLSRADKFIKVGKFGERYGYTLEARVNDDINELQETPGQWANIAARTEDDAALEVLANPLTGAPNTAVFNAQNANLGTGALTAANLQAAYTSTVTKRDSSGRLITAPAMQLIVGPQLQFTAQRILNTSEIRTTDANGQTVIESNPFAGKVSVTVLANLPGTAWFLAPVTTAQRPAFYMAFLAGFETPDLRQKADQGASMSGGALSADSGSFDDDTIWFRIRHIVGAAAGDATFTYASDGQGA